MNTRQRIAAFLPIFVLSGCATQQFAGSPNPALPQSRHTGTPLHSGERLLYSFLGKDDGLYPEAALLRDKQGDLYGTTAYGGTYGVGTVFKLDANGETILYRFQGGSDGATPVAPVIEDTNGNLYGTSSQGGTTGGTVFKLSPSGSGYTEHTLYTFANAGSAGAEPLGPVLRDANGSLYGTTWVGGYYEDGVVFKLTPSGSGYAESVLYAFKGNRLDDGQNPAAGLIADRSGDLFGTTQFGGNGGPVCGAYGCGTVFELTPSGSGYTERVIYQFQSGRDGSEPLAGLIMDSSGALYGTTFGDSVFKLSPSGSGYQETTLYDFGGDVLEGGLAMDTNGSLFGTTLDGGSHRAGTIFELTRTGGTYTEHTLYEFAQPHRHGYGPKAGVILRGTALLGTTYAGGSKSGGTVFEFTR